MMNLVKVVLGNKMVRSVLVGVGIGVVSHAAASIVSRKVESDLVDGGCEPIAASNASLITHIATGVAVLGVLYSGFCVVENVKLCGKIRRMSRCHVNSLNELRKIFSDVVREYIKRSEMSRGLLSALASTSENIADVGVAINNVKDSYPNLMDMITSTFDHPDMDIIVGGMVNG